jgi:hypothetical protein
MKRLGYRALSYRGVDVTKLVHDGIVFAEIPVGRYICTIEFSGLMDELKKALKQQPKPNLTLQTVIQAVSSAYDKNDLYVDCTCPDFCLIGNTKIRLVNGDSVTIDEMLRMHENEEDIWVYSVDKDGNCKPGHVTDVWISGRAIELVRVVLSGNRREIITTPSHRYMLSDGSYREARKLNVGDSLMTLSLPGESVDLCYGVQSIELLNVDPVNVYDITVEDYNNFCVDAGVILHNCYRFAYWATKYDYKSGKPETRPTKITNPNDKKGAVCKHLLAILSNKKWLVKLSTIINQYIKAFPKDIRKVLQLSDDDTVILNPAGRPKGYYYNNKQSKANIERAKNNEISNDSDNSDKGNIEDWNNNGTSNKE